MASDYLIVSKKILPEYLDKVIEVREMLAAHEASTITEAVKKAGISRNTYYKYKDYVYRPEEKQNARMAVISMVLRHEPGSLSEVLAALSRINASVVTISQSAPVGGKASILISLDITNVTLSADEIIHVLRRIPQVITAHLDSLE